VSGAVVILRRWKGDESNVRLEKEGDLFWVRWIDRRSGECGHGWRDEAQARADFASFLQRAESER
jgi:hypothetical protein